MYNVSEKVAKLFTICVGYFHLRHAVARTRQVLRVIHRVVHRRLRAHYDIKHSDIYVLPRRVVAYPNVSDIPLQLCLPHIISRGHPCKIARYVAPDTTTSSLLSASIERTTIIYSYILQLFIRAYKYTFFFYYTSDWNVSLNNFFNFKVRKTIESQGEKNSCCKNVEKNSNFWKFGQHLILDTKHAHIRTH